MKYITHKGVVIPLIGFGTWTIGDDESKRTDEVETIVYGAHKYNMTLIDTAEMYGLGKSETIVADAISRLDRDSLFIVGKILPENARRGQYIESCTNSLKRLGIEYFDLYLLHWRSNVNLQEMVDQMEKLVSLGLIKRWGVSNFDVEDMEDLYKCKNGDKCFCNQCLYNVGARGPEYDLIPWCQNHGVLFMAYSPLCNNALDRIRVTSDERIKEIVKKEDMTPESLLLNFVIRNDDIVTVFKTSNIKHLDSNLKNVFNKMSEQSRKEIDKSFPFPTRKIKLLKI